MADWLEDLRRRLLGPLARLGTETPARMPDVSTAPGFRRGGRKPSSPTPAPPPRPPAPRGYVPDLGGSGAQAAVLQGVLSGMDREPSGTNLGVLGLGLPGAATVGPPGPPEAIPGNPDYDSQMEALVRGMPDRAPAAAAPGAYTPPAGGSAAPLFPDLPRYLEALYKSTTTGAPDPGAGKDWYIYGPGELRAMQGYNQEQMRRQQVALQAMAQLENAHATGLAQQMQAAANQTQADVERGRLAWQRSPEYQQNQILANLTALAQQRPELLPPLMKAAGLQPPVEQVLAQGSPTGQAPEDFEGALSAIEALQHGRPLPPGSAEEAYLRQQFPDEFGAMLNAEPTGEWEKIGYSNNQGLFENPSAFGTGVHQVMSLLLPWRAFAGMMDTGSWAPQREERQKRLLQLLGHNRNVTGVASP